MEKTKSKKAGSSAKSKSSSGSKSAGSKSSSSKSSSSNQSDQTSMLEDLFIDELKDIYWAEKALTKALPKMEKAATSEELQNAFADHLEVTQTHVARLEEAFEILGEKAQAKKCEAMDGLIKEANSIIEDTDNGTLTRDVGLIMGAQKVEHYEIATYGSLAQLAKTLGKNDVADLMEQTLGEEKEADELLTTIAENNINVQAVEEGAKEEE